MNGKIQASSRLFSTSGLGSVAARRAATAQGGSVLDDAQRDDELCDVLVSLSRRSGLIALTTALLTVAVETPGAVAAGVRTSALDFKPADLEFPSVFVGVWKVDSVLTKVELPFGPEAVPDIRQVRRAEAEDLDVRRVTTMRFVRSERGGGAVLDRKYNTAALISEYMPGMDIETTMRRIQSPSPDHMVVYLPGGLSITSDITARMQQTTAPDALTTSEFYQQFIDDPSRPKLKASRADTKVRA